MDKPENGCPEVSVDAAKRSSAKVNAWISGAMQDETRVEVVQADTTAAAEFLGLTAKRATGVLSATHNRELTRLAQAFARHRIAFAAPPAGERIKTLPTDAVLAVTEAILSEAREHGADSPVDRGDAEQLAMAAVGAMPAHQADREAIAGEAEVAKKYVAELREIAGMVAQTEDGPLRWKQYRLAAIADYLGSLALPPTPSSGRDGSGA